MRRSAIFGLLLLWWFIPATAQARAQYCWSSQKTGKQTCIETNDTECDSDRMRRIRQNSGSPGVSCVELDIAVHPTQVGRGDILSSFCSLVDSSKSHIESVNVGTPGNPDLRIYYVQRDHLGQLIHFEELYNLSAAEQTHRVAVSAEFTDRVHWAGVMMNNPALPTVPEPDSIILRIARADLVTDAFVSETQLRIGVPKPPVPAFVAAWGTTGSGSGQFSNPNGLAVDASGNVYVADNGNNRVQVFTSTGTFVRQFGNSVLMSPVGVALGSNGLIYVLEYWGHRVTVFDDQGVQQFQFGSFGSGNGQFLQPRAIAADATGHVYVCSGSWQMVQKFTNAGAFVTRWGVWGSAGDGNGQFNFPFGIAVDNLGSVFVGDTNNHRVQQLNATSGAFITKWGELGSGPGELNLPHNLVIDGQQRIYQVDQGNDRVVLFSPGGGYITTWGSPGTGDGQFTSPFGIALSPDGLSVYVSDNVNNRIQKFGLPSIPTSAPETMQAVRMHFQVYPNPSFDGVNVSFSLPSTQTTKVEVFDVRGRLVRQVHDGLLPAGVQRVSWKRDNAGGAAVASGKYFIRLTTGTVRHTTSIVLLQ